MTVRNTMTKGFANLRKDARPEAVKAVGAGLLAILDDAQNEPPKPPIDTGLLRGSQFAIVEDTALVGDVKPIKGDVGYITGHVGFDAPYAEYVHEGMEPGPGLEGGRILTPGPKSEQAGGVGGLFLSLKLNRNRDRYARVIANRLKRYLGGGP